MNQPQELIVIHYIRAIASLTVAIFHIYMLFIMNLYDSTSYIFLKVVLEFIHSGGFGVCMFFLLSGYIIPYSYKNSVVEFFIRRIGRVFPVFLLTCLVHYCLVGNQTFNIASYSLIFANIFNAPFILEGLEWTLRIEMEFYLYIALCFYFKKFNIKYIYISSFFILGASIFIRLYLKSPICVQLAYGQLFLIGMLLYLQQDKSFSRKQIIYCLAIVCFNFLLVWCLFATEPHNYRLYPFLSVGIFILCIHFQKLFRSNKIILYLSNCSYSLYLLHAFLFPYIKNKLNFLLPAFLAYICAWVCLLIICHMIYNYFEYKLIKFSKKLTYNLKKVNKA